jgi:DNA-binding response OmpR family regulator
MRQGLSMEKELLQAIETLKDHLSHLRMGKSDFYLDIESRTITKDGAVIELTRAETLLMSVFCAKAYQWIPVPELTELAWGVSDTKQENTLRTLVLRLRKKLGWNTILAKRRRGYKFVPRQEGE